MAQRVAKKRNGVDKLISEIRRTNLLGWREFNFFKVGCRTITKRSAFHSGLP